MKPTKESAFFSVSKYRMVALIIMLALAIFAMLPWSFHTQIGGTTVTGITLTAMQIIGVILLVGDLLTQRSSRGEG